MTAQTPLEHVLRTQIPWRAETEAVTECGKRAIDVAAVIDFAAFQAKVKDQGQQRASMSTCMTCWGRSDYRKMHDWSASPSGALGREIQRQPYGDAENIVDKELRALAALVEAHRDEFDGYMEGLDQTVSLADHRRSKVRALRGTIA